MTGIDTTKQRLAAIWQGWSYPTRFVVLTALMIIGYKLAIAPARYHWYPPAGFCMAMFVLLPARYWATVVLAEWYHRIFWMNLNWWFAGDMANFVATTHIQFVPMLLAALWYRPYFRELGLRDAHGVFLLLVAMAAEALAGALTNSLLLFTGYFRDPISATRFFIDILLGNGIGNFISFAPIMALATHGIGPVLRALRSVAIWVVPSIGLLLLLSESNAEGLPPGYLRILAQLPGLVVAWRHGWPGAVFAYALSSSANRYFREIDTPVHALDPTAEMTTQMVVVVLGVASYLLGAAASGLRGRQAELEARNLDLQNANRANVALAEALREAAQRNLQLEATQRREIAAALHDEFGQNLTAMSVRLKLVEQQVPQAGTLDGVRQVIEHMRRSVRRLLDNLSPAALDEFGLRRALTEGPLRAMVEDAGLAYRLYLPGNPVALDALPDHLQGNVYRIIQEALTNTVRHAQAHTAEVRMRLGRRRGRTWLFLDLRDDGKGMHPPQQQRRRYGLQGIRDRVLAANGIMHLRSDERGTRLHVMLQMD